MKSQWLWEKEHTTRTHSMRFNANNLGEMTMLRALCNALREHGNCFVIETGIVNGDQRMFEVSWFVRRYARLRGRHE